MVVVGEVEIAILVDKGLVAGGERYSGILDGGDGISRNALARLNA